ncbi:MAG TPA: hypothetical protein VGE08_04040, partial [Steroidobacter sp.]
MADEQIVYYYKPLAGGTHHKYVLYLDSNGDVKGWARLGSSAYDTASMPSINKASPASVDYPQGKLYGAYGDESTWNQSDNPDWDSSLQQGGASSRGSFVAGEAPDLSNEWDQLTANIDALDAAEYAYNPLTVNCNSGMDTAISGISTTAYPDGLNLPDNDDLGFGEYWSPGSDITISGPGGGLVSWLVSEYLGFVADRIFDGWSATSPLVFDLDDSGTIELTSLANSTTFWDIDADGFAENSGWVTGGDGLLAIDLNDDGIINDNTELFGNSTGFANGFAALASYDLNHDWLINAEDAAYEDLIMWVDANENGYSEEAELYSLADLDIVSINLAASEVSQLNQGHTVTHTSTFTVDTGSGLDTRAVHDVWFQYDSANTFYTQTAPLDEDVSLLPTVRGYGDLPDLHFVVSSDDTGTGNLRQLVVDFLALDIDDIFTDDSAALDDVKDILFRWAGVDGVSPTSRGPNIDARELGFLEALTGEDFFQLGYYANPYYFAAQPLKEAFHVALNSIATRLIAQSAGKALFEGDVFYNVSVNSEAFFRSIRACGQCRSRSTTTGVSDADDADD